jgi:hypothetical protein
MFTLFNRGQSRPRTRLVRPTLEALEARDCPSTFGTQPGQELWYLLNTAPASGLNIKVQPALGGGGGGGGDSSPILTLSVTYNAKTSVTLSGKVTDDLASVAGLTVTFSGEAGGSATTDSNGNFSYTTNASGLGVVSAVTSNADGASNTATVTLSVPAPVISNFSAVQQSGYQFVFSGIVGAQTAAGLTITFGGLASLSGQTATVASNGSFQLVVRLRSDGSDNGSATAQTTDWWGQASNIATTWIDVTP